MESHATNHDDWRRKMAPMANAQHTQKDWSPGRMVNAPTPNAKTSVSEVTVMATPACFIVVAILSRGSGFSPSRSAGWGSIQ